MSAIRASHSATAASSSARRAAGPRAGARAAPAVRSRPSAAVPARAARRCAAAAADFNPPTVADTKRKFVEAYPYAIPALYNNVLQELLVQMHFTRWAKSYSFDPVMALGLLTVFEQLMDGYRNEEARAAVFAAYVGAMDEDPEQYKSAAASLEAWAKEQTSETLVAFAEQSGEMPAELQGVAARAKAGDFQYSKYFAVGMFRLLELSNTSEPSTLEKLCEALGVPKASVDKDLDIYRGLLSKLTSAKELMADFLARCVRARSTRAAARRRLLQGRRAFFFFYVWLWVGLARGAAAARRGRCRARRALPPPDHPSLGCPADADAATRRPSPPTHTNTPLYSREAKKKAEREAEKKVEVESTTAEAP